jgi:uncharacterized protein (TIGR02118 family)
MSKAIVLMRKRPEISDAVFRRHLREVHLPLVARLPGLRRLAVNVVVASADGGAPAYDAMAEDWFETPEAMQAAFSGPEGQAVASDVPNFLDPAQLRVLMVEEAEVPVASREGEAAAS